MKKIVPLMVLGLILQTNMVLATPPKPPRRDIKFEVVYDKAPSKVGDVVTFTVSFALEPHAKDTVEFARARLSVAPQVEYVSGDSVWSGYIEKGKKYSFTVTYRFTVPGRWPCYPLVQTYLGENGWKAAQKTSRTGGKGLVFIIPDSIPAHPKVYYPDSSNSQLVIFQVTNPESLGIKLPVHIQADTVEGTVHYKDSHSAVSEHSGGATMVVIPMASQHLEPVTIMLMPDAPNVIVFATPEGDTLQPDFGKVDTIPIIIETTTDGRYIFNTRKKEGSYNLRGTIKGETLLFRLKISSTWIFDGTFKFDDPFGTNDNRLEVVHYFKLHWDGQEWYVYDDGYTDGTGYFWYYSGEPHELVVPISENLYSYVFYAVDGEFNPGSGEDYAYYQHGVAVMNNYAFNDITIPDSLGTIDSLPLAGAFHIINVIRNGYTSFGYGYVYTLCPVYYHNFDSSIQGSYFGSYSNGLTKGIVIMGDTDTSDYDWDQWDSSVIVHETGHWFMYEQAEMPPNSGGPHVYTMPDTTAGHAVHNLYLAYSEGWANFYSCVGNERPVYLDFDLFFDTVVYFQIETPSPDVPYYLYMPQQGPSSLTPLYEGAHVEGSIDEALWDIYDQPDDGDYYIGPDIWGHNNDFNSGESWRGLASIMDAFWDFDPQPVNPDHDYCWNVYEFIHGWREEGYPVDSTFINIFEAHNVPVFLPGDVDDSGRLNVSDVTWLASYLKGLGPSPPHLSAADVNASCDVNVSDVTYLACIS